MDATEFGRELAAQVQAAIKAATEDLRAEIRSEVEAATEPLTAAHAGLDSQVRELAARETPTLPEVVTPDDVTRLIDGAVSTAVEKLQAEHAAEVAGLNALSTALTDATASLAEQVETLTTRLSEVESRKPERGEPGPAGVAPSADEVAAAMDTRAESRFATWALEWERRAQGSLERAIDRLPKPKDGRDGIDFETWDVELSDDGRTVTFTLGRGDDRLSKSFRLPTTIYHGTYSHGREYEAHDCVTWGGSMWITLTDKPDGTPGNSKDWKLAVKKGQAGKDGERIVERDPDKPVKIGGGK